MQTVFARPVKMPFTLEVRPALYAMRNGNGRRGLPYRVVIACLRRDHFRGLEIPGNVEICKVFEAEFIQLMAGGSLNVVPLKWLAQHVGGEKIYLNADDHG